MTANHPCARCRPRHRLQHRTQEKSSLSFSHTPVFFRLTLRFYRKLLMNMCATYQIKLQGCSGSVADRLNDFIREGPKKI
jgi:hypothetical protein